MRKLSRAVLVAFAVLLCACGQSEPTEAPTEAPAERDGDDNANDEPSAAPPGGFGGLGMMRALFEAQAGQRGPYDAPRESKDFDDGEPHFVGLELRGNVSELKTMSLFGGFSGTELRRIQDRLRELAANDKVVGLVIRFDGVATSLPTAEELRASIIGFKGEGKRTVHCHTEASANVEYFLMTACDSIGLAPTGQIVVSGVSAMPVHLKGLLDRLGVTADFMHVGAFKGAAEPLTRDKPSKEMVETVGAIMDDAYATLVDGFAAGRKLEPDAVRGLIDKAMFGAQDAANAKLVDTVATYETFRDKAIGDSGWQAQKWDDDALSIGGRAALCRGLGCGAGRIATESQ